MKKFSLLMLLVLQANTHANPASKEYVDNKIKEVINTFETKIPVIPMPKIGDMYQGGIVFWLDESKQHGLVISMSDIDNGTDFTWQNGDSGDKVTNAKSSGIKAGIGNTQLIISEQTIDDQQGDFAALAAFGYKVSSQGQECTTNCISDWYLPSKDELQIAFSSLNTDFFTSNCYWSSTEYSVSQAYLYSKETNETVVEDKYTACKVRAIHYF